MAIALLLIIFGVGINILILMQPRKAFPRFAKTCKTCGCQSPPMFYPPAVYDCPVCQWMEQRGIQNFSKAIHKARD